MNRSHLARPLGRRRFMQGLGLTLAVGSPVLLAACGEDDSGTSTDIDEANDLKYVQSACTLELAMVAGYTRVVTLLDSPALANAADLILAQEQQHANGLVTVIGDLGGTAPAPKSPAEYEQILGLAALKNQDDALRFAGDLEQMAIYSYIAAVPKLTIGDLRSTFASSATSEAEHASLLASFGDRGDFPASGAPAALVTGTKPTLELQ